MSAAFAEYVANTLPLTRLGDVVARCEIVLDPDPTRTVVAGDEWIVESEALLEDAKTKLAAYRQFERENVKEGEEPSFSCSSGRCFLS